MAEDGTPCSAECSKGVRAVLVKLVVMAALVYVGLALLLYGAQKRIIFPASRNVYRTPEAFGWDYEEAHLAVGRETTHTWYLPVENARGTLLFSHGNAGNIADRLESAAMTDAISSLCSTPKPAHQPATSAAPLTASSIKRLLNLNHGFRSFPMRFLRSKMVGEAQRGLRPQPK